MFDSVGVGVSTKWHRVSCHARRHQENTCFFVSEDDVKVESFCRFGLSVCMKCLSVVPGSFPGEEVQERNHCLFSGGLRSQWWLLLDHVFHPKLLFKITFYVSLKFLTLFVFFMFVRFSSRVRGSSNTILS